MGIRVLGKGVFSVFKLTNFCIKLKYTEENIAAFSHMYLPKNTLQSQL